MILEPVVAFSLGCIRDGAHYVLACISMRATRMRLRHVLVRSGSQFFDLPDVISRVQF